MRHGMANRKLGRTSSHRAAMFRNQLASLIINERIVTTLIKAKELRPIVEKVVTMGRKGTLHARRHAGRMIASDTILRKLFDELAPRYADRPGGYTRIMKLGPRRGDGAEMAILEFVDYVLPEEAAPAKPEKKSAKTTEPEKSEGDEGAGDEKAAKKPAAKKPAAKKPVKKQPAESKTRSAGKPSAKPAKDTGAKKKTTPRTKKGQ